MKSLICPFESCPISFLFTAFEPFHKLESNHPAISQADYDMFKRVQGIYLNAIGHLADWRLDWRYYTHR